MGKKIAIGVIVVAAVIAAVILFKKSRTPQETPDTKASLPVNVIPVYERPHITLTPDASGRNLTLAFHWIMEDATYEYELIYNAEGKQEGVFGRVDLAQDDVPIEKKLLLGSQSGGGKITYHEGVTGGSLTVTYDETRLKEQFNFLRFDPKDPAVSSSDVRFSVDFAATAFVKDTVIVIMKPFGLPTFDGLPEVEGAPASLPIIAGPYGYFAPAPAKGKVSITVKLSEDKTAGAALYEYNAKEETWQKLKTTLENNVLTALDPTGTIFVVGKE